MGAILRVPLHLLLLSRKKVWAAVRGKLRPQCERREASTGSGAEMRGDRSFPHPLWAPGLTAPERRAEQHSCISAEQWPRQKENRRFLEGKQLFLSFLLQLSEAASPKRPSSIPGSAACAHVGRNYIGVPAVPEKLEPRLQACLASLPPVQAT